jgi:hypothetical protein
MTMAPQQQPGSPATALFRKRLTLVTVALVAAQVLYAVVAISLLQSGFKAPRQTEPGGTLLLGIFLLGMTGVIVSVPLVKTLAKRQPAKPEFRALARSLLLQFIVGFVSCEIAGLAGLWIFFLYADLKTLYFLLWVAGTAIAAHFLRVKKALEEFEKAQRQPAPDPRLYKPGGDFVGEKDASRSGH